MNSYIFKEPKYQIDTINPYIELERKRILFSFFTFYIKELRQYLKVTDEKIHKQILLFLGYLHNKNKDDPVLLNSINFNIIKSIFVVEKVEISDNEIKKMVSRINKECKKNLKSMFSFKPPITENIIIQKSSDKDNVILQFLEIKHKIPKKLYDKIKSQQIIDFDFNTLLFCIITRYKYVYNYNTMHLAVPPEIYKELDKRYNVQLELFGSVMNKNMKYYCGLFYDLEKYFGNQGNFFNIELKEGFFVCNPPYEIYLINETYEKILKTLETSSKKITIFNVLPVWNKKYEKLIQESCEYGLIKDYDIYNIYDKIFNSKFLVYHKLYCKENFPFYHYLESKYINAAHCHVFVLSNTDLDPDFDSIFNKYKSIKL